jgi:hypothetical protein
VVTRQVDELDLRAKEPMIAVHPDGTLFVAGFGEPSPTLWKSVDRGATWSRVSVGDGAIGDSDVDIAIARDGTIYFATLVFDRARMEGVAVGVGASRDGGASWSWTTLTRKPRCDRPWVAVAPDGTAHVIWNDGDGVALATSSDRGATWNERGRVQPRGGSSHLAVGPRGELAVRVTPLSASGAKIDRGVDLIAISVDAGATWRSERAPGVREWRFPLADDTSDQDMPRWVEPVAWDAGGALYSLWANASGLWLARSRDQGRRWVTWRIDDAGAYFPYLVAHDAGELAATWYSGHGDAIRVHVARIDARADDAPRVAMLPSLQLDVHRASGIGTTGGEYAAVAFIDAGALGVVTPVHDPAAKRFGFTFRRIESR